MKRYNINEKFFVYKRLRLGENILVEDQKGEWIKFKDYRKEIESSMEQFAHELQDKLNSADQFNDWTITVSFTKKEN